MKKQRATDPRMTEEAAAPEGGVLVQYNPVDDYFVILKRRLPWIAEEGQRIAVCYSTQKPREVVGIKLGDARATIEEIGRRRSENEYRVTLLRLVKHYACGKCPPPAESACEQVLKYVRRLAITFDPSDFYQAKLLSRPKRA